MPNKKDEEIMYVQGALPCRITPAKKTIERIGKLAESFGAVHFEHELVEHEGQLYLVVVFGWKTEDFNEDLLQQFSEALHKLCKDSKEFLMDKQ